MATASIFLALPSDIFMHHLICFLDPASLITLAFVCSRFHVLQLRFLKKSPPKKLLFQKSILENIFRNGQLELLIWFRKNLVGVWMLSSDLHLAAEGMNNFYFSVFSVFFDINADYCRRTFASAAIRKSRRL